MPLFITPMKKAPMTTFITLPTPPEAETPPMKQAAMTSSSNRVAGARRRRIEARGDDEAREPREQAHVDEGEEDQPLGLDAGEPRREPLPPSA